MHHAYIPDDGYTERGYIAARPGLHPDVRFTFRPTTLVDYGRLTTAAKEMAQEEYDHNAAEFLATRILGWSVMHPKTGAILSIEFGTIINLKPALFERVFNIVAGYGPSDLDPEWSVEERTATAVLGREANRTGTAFGTVVAEGDAGNSSEG